MAYIGRDTDKLSNIEVLDAITFDGSSSYTLQKNSVNFTPSSANNVLVSIDGVVQANNFTVSGSTIDFGVAVPGTSTCDWIYHIGVGLITTPADGTVSLAKLSATGTKDATTFLRGDNTFASVSSNLIDTKTVLKTDTFSASVTAGSSAAVTDLSITHTLANSSNKLILMAYFGVAASADQNIPIGIALANDGTLIGVGDTAGSRTSVGAGGAVTGTAAGYVVSMPHIHLLYSPGDTSSHTYTVNIINVDTATRTLYVNRTLDTDDNAAFPRGVSAITLMEVSV